jgi:hypothetical protein
LRLTKIAFFLHLWKKNNLQKSQCRWVNNPMSKTTQNGSIEMKSCYVVLMFFLGGGGCSRERFPAIYFCWMITWTKENGHISLELAAWWQCWFHYSAITDFGLSWSYHDFLHRSHLNFKGPN